MILNKIKIANNLKTDTELANYLGITKHTLSNWRSRDTLDYGLVLSKCEHIDLNWLIKGEVEEAIKIEVVESQKNVEQLSDKKPEESLLNVMVDKFEALAKEHGYILKENESLKSAVEKNEEKIKPKSEEIEMGM